MILHPLQHTGEPPTTATPGRRVRVPAPHRDPVACRKGDDRPRSPPAPQQNGAMEPAQLDRPPSADLDSMPAAMHAMLFAALQAMGRHPEIRRVRAVALDALRPAPGQRLLD